MSQINTDILQALKNGDQKAFEKLFFEYFDRIVMFISKLLKSDAEAEELAQDIFVKIWVNRETFNPNVSLNAYMYTIARNATINHIKRKKMHASHVSYFAVDDFDMGTENAIHSEEITLLVNLHVDAMPSQRKRIFEMSNKDKMSNSEIAESLGISVKSVDNQMSIVRNEIRSLVAKYSG